MNFSMDQPTVMFENNQGYYISLISGPSGARTKHIDVCYHQIRDLQEKGLIDVQYCPFNLMLADILTKSLAKDQFETLIG